MKKSDIGLVGLGVMGANLALNMESKGFRVSVYNYVPEVTAGFMAGPGKGKNFCPAASYRELVESLKSPRMVFLMVTAGKAVDEVIGQLEPLLSSGDIIIDGGNSHFADTAGRTQYLESKGLLFVGTGVSGGSEGALKGPSMMPGGSPAAWPAVKPVFQSISAKAGGIPCCDWVGPGGAGHFVKMVHNGIEYGDIQLICETYQFMRDRLGMDNASMQAVFSAWNKGPLESYLIEITADILGKKDPEGRYVLDTILDTAGQKGTGKWTAVAALDAGVPVPMASEAVFFRFLSSLVEERAAASRILAGPDNKGRQSGARQWTQLLESALYASKIISYAQGFALLRSAAGRYCWPLDYGRIAQLWRGGCIIRSVFLDRIKEAFDRKPGLENLMLDGFFNGRLAQAMDGLRAVVGEAVKAGIPVPAMASALSYYDAYRCPRLGANLLQAQRDFFGAHSYERTDRPRGEFFHTEW